MRARHWLYVATGVIVVILLVALFLMFRPYAYEGTEVTFNVFNGWKAQSTALSGGGVTISGESTGYFKAILLRDCAETGLCDNGTVLTGVLDEDDCYRDSIELPSGSTLLITKGNPTLTIIAEGGVFARKWPSMDWGGKHAILAIVLAGMAWAVAAWWASDEESREYDDDPSKGIWLGGSFQREARQGR